MTTAESERAYPSLNCIKTFLRNSIMEDWLTALGMLLIENQIINNMNNFIEKVIVRFTEKKYRGFNLIYKHVIGVWNVII